MTDPLVSLLGPTESISPDGVMQIGETWTYSGSYELTQDDLDSRGTFEIDNNDLLPDGSTQADPDGDLDNTATASYTYVDEAIGVSQSGTLTDSAVVPLVYNPLMSVTKVADVDVVDEAGDIIKYAIVVSNDGNVTLTGVGVDDPLLGPLGAPLESGDANGVLDVGETWTYNGSYEVTQSDIDNNGIDFEGNPDDDGDIDNTVTASSDQTPDEQASEVVGIVYDPDMELVKVVGKVSNPDGTDDNDGIADEDGDVIHYNVALTNTGNVTLTDITVIDPLTGLEITVADELTLAPDETVEFATSYVVTQEDLNTKGASADGGEQDGFIDNTAKATSRETGGRDDSARVELLYDPSLRIIKSVDLDSIDSAGDTLTYTVVVDNTGNIDLTDVVVTDTLEGQLSVVLNETNTAFSGDTNDNGILEVDEIWTYTYTHTVTLDDINNNSFLGFADHGIHLHPEDEYKVGDAWFFAGSDVPPTGTGVIDSFLRVQTKNSKTDQEEGFNTDAKPQLDAKAGNFTHSIQLKDIPIVNHQNEEGEDEAYREFRLDLNEKDSGSNDDITLDDVQIFWGQAGDSSLISKNIGGGLSGATKIYDLNGTINLNEWSTGSGHGDYVMLIPESAFEGRSEDDFIYLYSKFSNADGGFEEWYVRHETLGNTVHVSTSEGASGSDSVDVLFDNYYGSVNIEKQATVNDGETDFVSADTDTIHYSISIKNTGLVDLTGLTFIDRLQGKEGSGSNLFLSVNVQPEFHFINQ